MLGALAGAINTIQFDFDGIAYFCLAYYMWRDSLDVSHVERVIRRLEGAAKHADEIEAKRHG